MTELRDELRAVVPATPEPDVDDLWSRGRAAARRRARVFAVGGLLLVVLGVAAVLRLVDGDDSATVDVVDRPEDNLPTVKVPEGALVTLYPLGLGPDWRVTVQPIEIGPEDTVQLSFAADDGGWRSVLFEGRVDGPLEFAVPSDSPADEELQVLSFTAGDGLGTVLGTGSVSPAELRAFVEDVLVGGLLDDPNGAAPDGWQVVSDARDLVGGAYLTASHPSLSIEIRHSTIVRTDREWTLEDLLLADPAAPSPESSTATVIAGLTARRFDNRDPRGAVILDGRSAHTIAWRDDSPLIEEFLDALQPVRGVASPPPEPTAADKGRAGPSMDDHWHSVYGIYVCDAFLPPFESTDDPEGIHSHQDGIVHIHPFNDGVTGAGATWSTFMTAMGWLPNADRSFGTLDRDTCGSRDARTMLLRWSADAQDEPPEVYEDEAIDAAYFGADGEVWVLAHVPAGTSVGDVPLPPQDRLDLLAEYRGN